MSSTLTITQNKPVGKTLVSNRFIDDYMGNANDAQIKIYLYLLRCAGTSLPSGISDIADHFNHTENDVTRALKYWDKLHVISLLYDDNKKLAGIRLEDLDEQPASVISVSPAVSFVERVTKSDIAVPELAPSSMSASVAAPMPASMPVPLVTGCAGVSTSISERKASEEADFDKFTVSLDQLKDFRNREETPQLLFIVEQYLGKTLSSNDIRSLYFMTDVLHFSTDLIDYLIQYCVGRGVKDFRYFEKVARSWSDSGITTPKQAASFAHKYDKSVYTIMRELGRSNDPAPKELNFIHCWIKDYGFSSEVILEACGRAVLATDKRRFEYTDGILSRWHDAGIRTVADINRLDSSRPKKETAPAKAPAANQFNRFTQNQYDYDDLLNKIKVN